MSMKIQIDGTNTLNKGAELMLLGILEQIEKKHKDAEVNYNSNFLRERNETFATNLNVKKRWALKNSRIPIALLKRLNLPFTYFTSKFPLKDIDLVLDGAGFQFSDQWNYSKERLDTLENYYKKLKENNTKIVLLPQALGPFKTLEGKRMVQIMNKYADIVIAREKASYNLFIEAGGSKDKLWLYPDFTILVKGKPCRLDFVKNSVCIIPNERMITHKVEKSNNYLEFMEKIISELIKNGENVFLLNHEGNADHVLCQNINKKFNNSLKIVSNLSAKEIKGVIGASKMVVSSRFHGAASALNQGVPCLATSWNHKYQMLFEDFAQPDNILSVENDWDTEINKILKVLNNRNSIQEVLLNRKNDLSKSVEKMWEKIWEYVGTQKRI